MPIRAIALDLDGTLINNHRTARPRPGLHDFLAFCAEQFDRVLIFSTLQAEDAQAVISNLAAEGHVPPGLLERLEYVGWSGDRKNLEFIPDIRPDEVLLVEDEEDWVDPAQQAQWIPIAPWEQVPDDELARVRSVLEQRLRRNRPFPRQEPPASHR